MTNSRRSPTDWERGFFAGDPSALDDLASNVHDLTAAVLALLTGTQPWELKALALLGHI